MLDAAAAVSRLTKHAFTHTTQHTSENEVQRVEREKNLIESSVGRSVGL